MLHVSLSASYRSEIETMMDKKMELEHASEGVGVVVVVQDEKQVMLINSDDTLIRETPPTPTPTSSSCLLWPWARALVDELKRVAWIAAPMVAVTVSQYMVEVVSLMMVGHIDKLSLSGVAMATSLCTVSGFSVLLGMAGALETLGGQAYGAEQYKKVGLYTYCAMISLVIAALPLSLLWIFMEKLLILAAQDPLISREAGKYATYLIPTLFAYAILQALVRYFQTQSLIFPMVASSFATLGIHTLLCWAFVFKLSLGITGAAFANALSSWSNVIFLGLYIKYSSSCEKTRVPFSKDVFQYISKFFRLAVPSAVMVCLEWWSFEVLIVVSGLLPNPKLETSVLSICLTITSLHYFIPYGFGAAASTRVSNELGAGNPNAARLVVRAVMVLAISEAIIVSALLFSCRRILGYAYSNDKEVVDYVSDITFLICLSVILDSSHATLSGVARGSGWQDVGACVNLGAFYLVGLPAAGVLGFIAKLRGKGLWIGTEIGSMVQLTMLALITAFANWNKQAIKARGRISEEGSAAVVELNRTS